MDTPGADDVVMLDRLTLADDGAVRAMSRKTFLDEQILDGKCLPEPRPRSSWAHTRSRC
jgi:hypothetical protein